MTANGQVTIRRTPTKPGDLCGVYEVAQLLGVEAAQVSRWHRLGQMPTNYSKLQATPVWYRRDVMALRRKRQVEARRREAAAAAREQRASASRR